MSLPIIVGITGASGVVYGQRLVEVLIQLGHTIHLSISTSGQQVLNHERKSKVDLNAFQIEDLIPGARPSPGQLIYHHYQDFMTPIASGSFKTRAMVICPCSGSTLSGIATASSGNLIQRAADVHLKERRPLILVPRETPLSLLQIENLQKVTLAGATVLPASPGFYHGAERVEQLIDFIVARILDQLGIDQQLMKQWGT
ncbi:MAG: flavin prenyltransferase UbiX [Pirellulaceae bacterium]